MRRDSPAVSAGAAWRPLARCRAILPLRKARCGWDHMVMSFTVRRGELINIVAHFDSDSWTEESWTRECNVSELTTTEARRSRVPCSLRQPWVADGEIVQELWCSDYVFQNWFWTSRSRLNDQSRRNDRQGVCTSPL
jgi:hypothetical protein